MEEVKITDAMRKSAEKEHFGRASVYDWLKHSAKIKEDVQSMNLYEVAIIGRAPDGSATLLLKPTPILAVNEDTAGVIASTKLTKMELTVTASLEVLVRKFSR